MQPLETVKEDQTLHESPWPFKERLIRLAWHFAWPLLCRWTPKPLSPWRCFVLRCFGCKIHGRPFVHQAARIIAPWRLTLHHESCVGDGTDLYTMGEIEIGPRAIVAQEAYLCTGTHDLSQRNRPLQVAKILIEEEAFIGARAFVLPGVTIGRRAVVGACSVVTKDVAEGVTVAGNPARELAKPESRA